MKPSLVTLFSGGRYFDVGAHAAGFESVLAVEYHEKICEAASVNFTDKALRCADVRDVDYRSFFGVDALHASPVCTRASVANPSAVESELDRECGEATARAIREIRPKIFTLENVRGYLAFDAYRLITQALRDCDYVYEEHVRNSADWGVPQTRERLIVRAVRRDVSRYLPEFVPTHGNAKTINRGEMDLFSGKMLLPWNGWYGAVADLLPRCHETTLAPWQIARLGADITDSVLMRPKKYGPEERGEGYFYPDETSATLLQDNPFLRAVLIPGIPTDYSHDSINALDGSGNAPIVTASQPKHPMRAVLMSDQSASAGEGVGSRSHDEPAHTVATANHTRTIRAVLSDCKVVALAPEGDPVRCMARFQAIPDWYILPKSRKLASTMVGNGVPSLLAQRIMESLKVVLWKSSSSCGWPTTCLWLACLCGRSGRRRRRSFRLFGNHV